MVSIIQNLTGKAKLRDVAQLKGFLNRQRKMKTKENMRERERMSIKMILHNLYKPHEKYNYVTVIWEKNSNRFQKGDLLSSHDQRLTQSLLITSGLP
uniref:Transposase n=1 Tax=Heterorhabditis bacteriophora TaxID=37862 RepID=A0A1I7XSR9_HETBA